MKDFYHQASSSCRSCDWLVSDIGNGLARNAVSSHSQDFGAACFTRVLVVRAFRAAATRSQLPQKDRNLLGHYNDRFYKVWSQMVLYSMVIGAEPNIPGSQRHDLSKTARAIPFTQLESGMPAIISQVLAVPGYTNTNLR